MFLKALTNHSFNILVNWLVHTLNLVLKFGYCWILQLDLIILQCNFTFFFFYFNTFLDLLTSFHKNEIITCFGIRISIFIWLGSSITYAVVSSNFTWFISVILKCWIGPEVSRITKAIVPVFKVSNCFNSIVIFYSRGS